ncbi:DUF1015 domain-containing protein [Sedimenticola thiotaurini]|uniref:DUF1015 domain-containing protein n=1 Tax=Sedimenticola thiotaurini TaxID=1543721 RepID=A0A0F7JXJ0_9GAMM|nr:DUF1015 family protein [Sedimenticola thiotaurini]AKH20402.1 hypothetical protein AAY24_08610 [Sedimenticola thiotaurini]
MSLIRAFPGLRPADGRAEDVAAPPYDVLSEAEAREMVKNRPWSFLHISRPEVDLPAGIDPHAPEVYAKAAENLAAMRREGVLTTDSRDCYYVYRLTMGAHTQLGVVAAASVDAYDSGRIKRHELTRPDKELDRVKQISALNAQTGPVFLVYPSDERIDDLLRGAAEGEPAMDVTASDSVRHQIWVLSDRTRITALTLLFDELPALYIADGHHRSAAASRVAAQRKLANPQHTGNEPYNYFLSVIFPHKQTQILDYNRVVRDLNGMTVSQFLQAIGERFQVESVDEPVKPEQTGHFGMYLDGSWYRLVLPESRIPSLDPVASLDVSLLSHEILEPVLGISDQRTDSRIDFVGGIRGLKALEQRVDSGEWAVAFALYPTSMNGLMAVADAGQIMPPKSTWFEPKLADGLVSHLLE